ncbi:MAG TPA: hypothetical protein VGB37_17140 [Candidatus Lokiarchaeia archaeon]
MEKLEYIHMITDNIIAYRINLPEDLKGDKLNSHLNKFEAEILRIVAGFNKIFLEHFLIVSKGTEQKELKEILKKMELISFMIGPTGNLNYISPKQIEYILTKLGGLKLNEITEDKMNIIADEQLEKEFGSQNYGSQSLENSLASAAFYLINQGYTEAEVKEKVQEVRQDPSKLDYMFSLPPKDIYSVPSELQGGLNSSESSDSQEVTIVQSEDIDKAIDQHIQSLHQENSQERAQKLNEIFDLIKKLVKELMTEQYERVYLQIHPDRLNKAFKFLKQSKRKKVQLLLDWFFCSHLLSSIELKVEHWQVSSHATQGSAGVYTAGIDFSRYDNIVKEFSENKLAKVINIARKILQNPSKKAIQKLGQDLTAETGFDEHLYFTD